MAEIASRFLAAGVRLWALSCLSSYKFERLLFVDLNTLRGTDKLM